MKIFIASDHAGFELKQFLIDSFKETEYEFVDCGAYQLVEGDDYPQYISKVALDVSEAEQAYLAGAIEGEESNIRGIIIGGSGQGEAIVANRYPHVRAAVYYGENKEIIKLSREHNDANVLSLGARFLSNQDALEAVKLWFETHFSGDARHIRRIEETDEYPDTSKSLFA